MKYFLSYLESGRALYGEPPYVVCAVENGKGGEIISNDDMDYLAWLAEGNEPQEWQPQEAE